MPGLEGHGVHRRIGEVVFVPIIVSPYGDHQSVRENRRDARREPGSELVQGDLMAGQNARELPRDM